MSTFIEDPKLASYDNNLSQGLIINMLTAINSLTGAVGELKSISENTHKILEQHIAWEEEQRKLNADIKETHDKTIQLLKKDHDDDVKRLNEALEQLQRKNMIHSWIFRACVTTLTAIGTGIIWIGDKLYTHFEKIGHSGP